MGLMLSRLWIAHRRRGVQYIECNTEEAETLSLKSNLSAEETGFLVSQVPIILDGGSPVQKLPQDLILK